MRTTRRVAAAAAVLTLAQPLAAAPARAVGPPASVGPAGSGTARAEVTGAGAAGVAAAGAAGVAAAGAAGANTVSAFGSASAIAGSRGPFGSAPVVGIAADRSEPGFWVTGADGRVFGSGRAAAHGSLAGVRLDAPIVGIAARPSGGGYWLAAADGGVFAFGDAAFHGGLGGIHLNAPIVGIAPTPTGRGYWLVASDGGIFAFGDAAFHGSTGNLHLNAPVVGMAPTANGGGYWLVASDGGIFAFGDAAFHGSTGNLHLNAPVVGMAPTANGGGYWLAASDGGVFAFAGARFEGSGAATPGPTRAVGIAAVGAGAAAGAGYWIAYGRHGSPIPAIASYVATRADNVTVDVEDLTTGQTYAYRPGVVEHTASTVKVDILATLLREAQAAGRPLTASEQALAVPMIEDSLDSAADALWVQLGAGAVATTERQLGLSATVPPGNGIWGTTTTTAADRVAMVRSIVFPETVLSSASRAYVLNLMEHITPAQDWGATGGVPAGVTVALKNGFSIINGWQINTMGWVNGLGRNYLIAVLTDENPTEAYGIQTANAISSIVWNALG